MRLFLYSAAVSALLASTSLGVAQTRTPDAELEKRCGETKKDTNDDWQVDEEVQEADDISMRFMRSRRYPWPHQEAAPDEETNEQLGEGNRFGSAYMIGTRGRDAVIEGDILVGTTGGMAFRHELQQRYGSTVEKGESQDAAAALKLADPAKQAPTGFLAKEKIGDTARALLYSMRSELPVLTRGGAGNAAIAADMAEEAEMFVAELQAAPAKTRFATPTTLGRLWKLPIKFDVSSFPAARQKLIRDAVKQWNTDTGMNLLEEVKAADTADLAFVPGSGCSSYVGKSNKSPQPIKLATGCGAGAIRHEIGHALGLFHEQSHPERDKFVEILWANIPQKSRYNFRVATNISKPSTYDYCSIMHYGETAFGGGKQTIRPLQAGVDIGQRKGPSVQDVQMIRALYNRTTVE